MDAEKYVDPLVGQGAIVGNFNTALPSTDKFKRLEEKKLEEKQKQLDAIDKKILDMKQERQSIPTIVNHSKDMSRTTDIIVNNITIIVGGKTLLDGASLKLAYGRKYGLVGRNGIGKTTLLNHIARKEIDNFPTHIHVLHVEQEIDPDNKRVIDHILECDIERTNLLKEHDELMSTDPETLKKAKREEHT